MRVVMISHLHFKRWFRLRETSVELRVHVVLLKSSVDLRVHVLLELLLLLHESSDNSVDVGMTRLRMAM